MLAVLQPLQRLLGAAHRPQLAGHLPDAAVQTVAQPVVGRQVHYPGRDLQRRLLQREAVQHLLQDLSDVLLVQLHAVDRRHRYPVALLQLRPQASGGGAFGRLAVQHHHKRLVDGLQLPDDPALGLLVLGPRDLRNAAVGGHHQPDGGMLVDDLAGAALRRHVEGHLLIVPGGHHHAGLLVFDVAQRAGYDVPHAVDHPHAEADIRLQRDADRLLRDKFRLGGHDGAARRRLRQLIGPAPGDRRFRCWG